MFVLDSASHHEKIVTSLQAHVLVKPIFHEQTPTEKSLVSTYERCLFIGGDKINVCGEITLITVCWRLFMRGDCLQEVSVK